MITDNKDKKALVEKLIQDKVITLDQGMLLLETDKEYISSPYPVYPYMEPGYWYWDGSKMAWRAYTYPSTGTLSSIVCGGTCIVTNDKPFTVTGTVTSYPPGTAISYTTSTGTVYDGITLQMN